jgi:hypothetical protein
MIRLILGYARVKLAYSFVFTQTNIGIDKLLEISNLALRDKTKSK